MWWTNQKFDLKMLKNLDYPISNNRKNFNIALIDDEVFSLLEPLRKLEFTVTKFDDIQQISELKGFDIVIADIRGVGAAFDKKFGGAYIIKEIQKKYPSKYLIVCSGSTFKVDYNVFFNLADINVKKGTGLSEWVTILDNAIKKINNPYFQWEKTRKFLHENDIDSNTINKLEQAYIKSIIKKDINYFNKSVKRNNSLMSNEYIAFSLNTISNLTSSIISNILMAS